MFNADGYQQQVQELETQLLKERAAAQDLQQQCTTLAALRHSLEERINVERAESIETQNRLHAEHSLALSSLIDKHGGEMSMLRAQHAGTDNQHDSELRLRVQSLQADLDRAKKLHKFTEQELEFVKSQIQSSQDDFEAERENWQEQAKVCCIIIIIIIVLFFSSFSSLNFARS
jgi:hypothetical protein